MALLQINCERCGHTFFRVAVGCSPAASAYACPACGTDSPKIAPVPTPAGVATAETSGCRHTKTGGCHGCTCGGAAR